MCGNTCFKNVLAQGDASLDLFEVVLSDLCPPGWLCFPLQPVGALNTVFPRIFWPTFLSSIASYCNSYSRDLLDGDLLSLPRVLVNILIYLGSQAKSAVPRFLALAIGSDPELAPMSFEHSLSGIMF